MIRAFKPVDIFYFKKYDSSVYLPNAGDAGNEFNLVFKNFLPAKVADATGGF